MNIEVKGINDILVMKCNENVCFDEILKDFNELLEQPIFNQDSYYPRAFFDFGCRQLQNNELKELIKIISEKKKILFEGISIPRNYQHIHMNKEQIVVLI